LSGTPSTDPNPPGNDIVDTLATVASNLPFPEELAAYQQAVAEITIKTALLV
jgi:hypothetical protein